MIDSQLIEKIKNSWEKPIGLLLAICLIISLYFGIINTIGISTSKNSNLFNIWVPTLLPILLIFYWLISTYRLPGLKKRDITIGIFLKLDEDRDKYESRFRELVKGIINNINSEYPEIKLKLYPINYFHTEKKLVNYIQSMNYSLDTAIYAEVSGVII